MKLGKKPPRHDARTLKLVKYLLPTLPPPPVASDYTTGIKTWPMLLNDSLGDCVPAGFLHGVQTMTANSGTEHIPTDTEAVDTYMTLSGYDGTDASDEGCDMLTAIGLWESKGIVGHQIDAYAAVNINDLEELKQAVHLFGCAPIGVMLPHTAEKETDAGMPWVAISERPDPTRGHCVVVVKYDEKYFYVVTWGQIQAVSPEWLMRYMDEAYAPLSIADWGKNSPVAIDIAALTADLKSL